MKMTVALAMANDWPVGRKSRTSQPKSAGTWGSVLSVTERTAERRGLAFTDLLLEHEVHIAIVVVVDAEGGAVAVSRQCLGASIAHGQ